MAKTRGGSRTTKRPKAKSKTTTRKPGAKSRKATQKKRKTRRPAPTSGRPRRRATMEGGAIDVAFKGALILEPARDNNPENLDPDFRQRLVAALVDLSARGTPFKFVEGFRTVERQQWLFGSGRPDAVPFGRAGSIVTQRDGVRKLSNHQGDGTPGSGKGADCYPLKDGRVFIPPVSDPLWQAYAEAIKRQGLKAGIDFPTLRDAPHCELV